MARVNWDELNDSFVNAYGERKDARTNWERISQDTEVLTSRVLTSRLRVPGGWLYMVTVESGDPFVVFVPGYAPVPC